MKKPSLKRKKEPTPQEFAASPALRRKKEPKRKKEPTPQQLAAAPAPKQKAGRGGALGKPLGKLAGLRGRTRIVVYALLAVVVLLLAFQLRGGADDKQQVREALATYEKASDRKNYQQLCDDLLASSYVRQTAGSGLPCEVALRTALEDVRNPELEVLSVTVDGDSAKARVRGSAAGQVPGEADYKLVREDDAWKILPPRADSSAAP